MKFYWFSVIFVFFRWFKKNSWLFPHFVHWFLLFSEYFWYFRNFSTFLNIFDIVFCHSHAPPRPRLNDAHMRQNVLERLPQMGEITLPTNYIDWNSKQLNLPPPTKERQEWPATSPRHPHYVLVRSDDTNQRLGKLSSYNVCNWSSSARAFLLFTTPESIIISSKNQII